MKYGNWEVVVTGKNMKCSNRFIEEPVRVPLYVDSISKYLSIRPLCVRDDICLLNLWDKEIDMSRDVCLYIKEGKVKAVSIPWCEMYPRRSEVFISASGDIMKRKNKGNRCVISKLNRDTGRFIKVADKII